MIVVGTGPAGLTAAYLLAKRGHKVTLMDEGLEPGGLWAGWTDEGRHFERGMHNYMSIGIPEIDEFWMPRDLVHTPLEGNARDLAGVYANGRLYTMSPSIDVVDDPMLRQMVMETMWAAFSPQPGSNRALDRATAKWGSTAVERHIKPALKKIFGTTQLDARALDLTNLHRLVMSRDCDLVESLIESPRLRDRIAWPNQTTLPPRYSSGRTGFYPAEGMIQAVHTALGRLSLMGVELRVGVTPLPTSSPMVWAAGLPKLAKALGINFPPVETRGLTVVNLAGCVNVGPLHYFFNYEPNHRTFRVTCYHNFSLFQQTQVELLDAGEVTPAKTALDELRGMGVIAKHTGPLEIVGVHHMPSALIVPTNSNDHLLDHLRTRLARPGLHLVGMGARNNLFFQHDVLRHVWNVCHLQIGENR